MHKKNKGGAIKQQKNLMYHFGTKLMYIFKIREEDFPQIIIKKRFEIKMILKLFLFWCIGHYDDCKILAMMSGLNFFLLYFYFHFYIFYNNYIILVQRHALFLVSVKAALCNRKSFILTEPCMSLTLTVTCHLEARSYMHRLLHTTKPSFLCCFVSISLSVF